MQYFGTIGEIKERAEAINLAMTRLCELAGVAPSTGNVTSRTGETRDPRVSTLKKLSEHLLGYERAQLKRLALLHPDLVTVNARCEAAE